MIQQRITHLWECISEWAVITLFFFAIGLKGTACLPVSNPTLVLPTSQPSSTAVPKSTSVPTATPKITTLTPTSTITPTPTRTPTPTPDPICAASGSLPDAQVKRDIELLYQPNGSPVAGAPRVTKGRCVILFGKDETEMWYRVLFSDVTGWVPADSVDFPAKKLDLLRAPPLCAKPRAITRNLNEEWTSNYSGRVVVVVDLYRARLGADFPNSTFQIKVNGRAEPGKDRAVSSRGQYLMRSTPVGVTVKQGDKIGFTLITTSREPLKFLATYFAVPDGCNFDDRQ